MLTSDELKQQATAEKEKGLAILEKAGDDPTDEQIEEAAGHKAAADALLKRAELQAGLEDKEAGRTAKPGAPSPVVEVVGEAWERDPNNGFGEGDHNEFMSMVMESGLPSRKENPRIRKFRATVGSDEQGVYDDAYGGYLLPESIAPGVLSVPAEMDPLAPYINSMPMGTEKVTFNARVDKNHSTSVAGGLVFTRRAETEQFEGSRMEFEQIEMNAHELTGLAYATERVLRGSPQSFVSLLNNGFRDALTDKRMRERLRGSGNGEPLGVLSLTAGTDGLISVTKETNQAGSTIVTENIDKMAARCWKYSRAVWLANHNTRPQLRALSRAVGTGGELARLFTNEGGNEMLDGRPIFFSEYAAALGTVGDIILGVWSEYLYGVYQPLERATSVHVRFEYNERTFKFWLMDDGQPWWKTALTPFKGDTLAPFIVLATRS